MTEEEWLASEDPWLLVDILGENVSPRKLRLFACEFARQSPEFDEVQEWIELAESYLDGMRTGDELLRHRERRPPSHTGKILSRWMLSSDQLIFTVSSNVTGILEPRAELARILRDVFGNPFRPVAVDSGWRTATVVSLATAIYDERAFDRMPILGDALEEAGCQDREILDHCRRLGDHVRGCWVVDLLLGKSGGADR